MRISLDFGDGSGLLDYSAALVAPTPTDRSNVPTNVQTFRIERQAGAFARCRGSVNAAAFGLQPPRAGCRVVVRSNAGTELFSGVVVVPPLRVSEVVNAVAPTLFEAVEDAFLANTAPDVSLQRAGAATHAVQFDDNAIALEQESAAETSECAGDVLVTGAEEAVTYMTELFQGDGTTSTFALTTKPFVPGGSATLLADSFAGTQFRGVVWSFADAGQHIGLGTGGLRVTGGNGFDGQTYMAAREPVELGGTLCAEMRGVVLQPGSAGVLLGMYSNVVAAPACLAGVQVNAAEGALSVTALVNGRAAGTAMPWTPGHSYTFRLRLHCAEMQRRLLSYQAVVNGALQTWGGGVVNAPMQTVVEMLDEGLASSTPATALYAGAVSGSDAEAIFAPVNSVSLLMSAGSVSLKQQGSAWVTTTAADGTVTARRPGAPETGEDYRISGTSLEFFSGRVPLPGTLVTVRYRMGQRAQARVQSAAAVEQMQQMGLPGLRSAAWRVSKPEPRSSADCAAAAEALLAFYGSPAYGVRGTCSMPDTAADVQPGDAVALPISSATVTVPIESVLIESGHSVPETLHCKVSFAQGKSNGLSFATEAGAAADAELPAAVYAAGTTASLPELAVTVAGAASMQVDAGAEPPVGGGFEVRRHDGGWGPDGAGAQPDSELVLRSPVRSFSVPRAAFAERFYVRMYDGSETPVYSAVSSLVCTHLPVA